MNRIKTQGSRTAQDGSRIEWDLRGANGHEVLRYNAAGVLQTGTCGEIEMSYLLREIRKFLREHAGVQLGFEEVE